MIVKGVGTDVSKDHLDVCVYTEAKEFWRRFPNSSKGFAACLKWLKSFAETIEFVYEPTGRYAELFVEFMHKKGCIPLQANPFEVSRYAEGLDMRTTTDRKAAYALARYAFERLDKCKKWQPCGDHKYELRDIQLLLRSLGKRCTTVTNQLKCGLRSDFVRKDLNAELDELERRFDDALKRAEIIIRNDEVLCEDFDRLLEIPGIAEQTATLLLTLVDFRAFRSGRAVACFLGLTPRKHESGTSVKDKEHISKCGSKYVRSQLWMPVRTTRRNDPVAHALAARLLAKEKHDWLVQVAVIRRLVTVAWAVVAKGVAYDPNYRHPLAKPI